VVDPGQRRVQDWARDAFARIEADVRRAIASELSPSAMRRCLDSVHSQRPAAGCSHLEWLKTPSKREALEKIGYLKSLGVPKWSLAGVGLPRQRARFPQREVALSGRRR
jgi:hypothetical protein